MVSNKSMGASRAGREWSEHGRREHMPSRVRPLEYFPPAASPSVADRAHRYASPLPTLSVAHAQLYLTISTQEMGKGMVDELGSRHVRYVLGGPRTSIPKLHATSSVSRSTPLTYFPPQSMWWPAARALAQGSNIYILTADSHSQQYGASRGP